MPQGFKAMIVTPDRYACVQYKEELDKHLPEVASKVVISTTANDEFEFKHKWGIDKSQQEKIIDEFNDESSDLKFIIVTAKLLTGFDSPILQTMYLDTLESAPGTISQVRTSAQELIRLTKNLGITNPPLI